MVPTYGSGDPSPLSNVNYNSYWQQVLFQIFERIYLVLDFSGLQLNPEIFSHFYIRRPAYFCQMII